MAGFEGIVRMQEDRLAGAQKSCAVWAEVEFATALPELESIESWPTVPEHWALELVNNDPRLRGLHWLFAKGYSGRYLLR